MEKAHERMTRAVSGLGEQAVLLGKMDYAEAATGGVLGALKLLILDGRTTDAALNQMIDYLVALKAELQNSRVTQPPRGHVNITAREHPGGEGPLAGERIVFTGATEMPRAAAAALAAELGAHCSDSVSAKTTILVVGEFDAGSRPTGKQTKAEQMISQGAGIRIMSEAEFIALCNSVDGC